MSSTIILVSLPLTMESAPFQAKLAEFGYDLAVMTEAEAVLERLRQNDVAAVLVDIATPELRGVVLCDRIRQQYPTLKIVALNQAERRLHQAAMNAGADIVLDQPVNWSDLFLWLESPRSPSGKLLASGALFGSTPDDVLGSVALLAHDLKSPITVVISSLQTLISLFEEDNMPELQMKLMKGALYSAYRQMYLVSDVIDLARLELDNYELQLTRFNLSDFVRECVQADRYALDTKGLVLTLDLPEEAVWIEADAELMRRVLSAMIDNSLKFTIRGDQLTIAIEVQGEMVELRFCDTGRTIRDGYSEEISTRAPQWAARQTGTRTSVAMGLPFVREVMRAHGGWFEAASEQGVTAFRMYLPLLKDGPLSGQIVS